MLGLTRTGFATSPIVKRIISTASSSAPSSSSVSTSVPTRATFVPYYDKSRIIDREHLTVLDPMGIKAAQSNAEERGDTEPTSGQTVPALNVATRSRAVTAQPTQETPDWVKPALVALAGFLIFGG